MRTQGGRDSLAVESAIEDEISRARRQLPPEEAALAKDCALAQFSGDLEARGATRGCHLASPFEGSEQGERLDHLRKSTFMSSEGYRCGILGHGCGV
jgi:hypothetical protein